jgi:hypothetical protein
VNADSEMAKNILAFTDNEEFSVYLVDDNYKEDLENYFKYRG